MTPFKAHNSLAALALAFKLAQRVKGPGLDNMENAIVINGELLHNIIQSSSTTMLKTN